MGLLLEEMNRLGVKTKVQTLSNGKHRGGVSYGKGALAHLLKNRCYVGEISHHGAIHAADHEPIVDRRTFDAVQGSLVANAVTRKAVPKASDYLLSGYLFDSAGNRMTPSHSRKKGVRYRYYVSQAILQSRKDQAGQISRVPAADIEAQIEQFVRLRAADPKGDVRALIKAQVAKITVQTASLSVELTRADRPGPKSEAGSGPVISLPWSKQPSRAAKGIVSSALARQHDPDANHAIATAVSRARRWLNELLAGRDVSDIAAREGKSLRQIRLLMPLAFVPPRQMGDLIAGRAMRSNVAKLAREVPLVWPQT
jgi:hypothetical protein